MAESPYAELNHATESRTLILHQGNFEDAIACDLQHFSLDSPPAYEALSYIWGKPLLAHDITLAENVVKVTDNLELALRYLRHVDRDRMLWIDAICINQIDNSEKTHQVGQMGKIYQQAQSVIVWLGPAADRSDEAMDLIKRMTVNTALNEYGTRQGQAKVGHYQSNQSVQNNGFASDLPGWSLSEEPRLNLVALSFLMDRQWFRRRWVAQEISFAATAVVQCGHAVIPWVQFTNVVEILQDHQDAFVRNLYGLTRGSGWPGDRGETGRCGDIRARNPAYFWYISKELLLKNDFNKVISYQADIEALVTGSSDLHVSNPRDFVYSLLPLAKDTHDLRALIPDYRKPALEVCIDLTNHVIQSKRSLDLICQPWAPRGLKLPSWITPRIWPKYFLDAVDYEYPQCGAKFVGSTGRGFYNASAKSCASAEITKDLDTGYILRARGCMVDTIKHVGDCAQNGNIPVSWLTAFMMLLGQLKFKSIFPRR